MGHNLEPQNTIEKEEEKRGFQNNGFNQFRSDRIPLDREVPDTRDPRCVCLCVSEGERERGRWSKTSHSHLGVWIGGTLPTSQRHPW